MRLLSCRKGGINLNNIRQATSNDISRILVLYEELTEEKIDISSDTARRVFSQIDAVPGQEFLVVENDGLVVGTLFLLIVPNLTHAARPWAVIENVVVDSKYHQKGFGRLLTEYALARCRKAGCYKVQLLSNKKRTEAHKFYRSLGFDESALGFRLYL
jgi:N-acetylglutamate synthase-like GNAT family acetyltransferase